MTALHERQPLAQWLLNVSQLRDRALAADSLNGLAFSMANDLHPLLHFHQALVFAQQGQALQLLCVSGLAKPSEDSPYLVWLRSAMHWLGQQITGDQPQWLNRDSHTPPPAVLEGWSEWWTDGLWCVPLHDRHGRRLGLVLFLLPQPPSEPLPELLRSLWPTWAYCWAALTQQRRLSRWRPTRRQVLLTVAVLALLLWVPVNQTVLAPAEVVSLQAQIISAPIDGVIATIHVRPNQQVQPGTLLLSMDETSLRSRTEVLSQEVAVADAEWLAASQSSFDSPQSKSELTLLSGRAQQRRAELAAVQAQLKRTQVLAPRAGVVVFGDPNDWLGKPVSTGERIMLLADPAQPAMRIRLPAADAIALEPGAAVTLFLSAYPLSPLNGQVLETSYQARPGDDGVPTYRLLASIEGHPEHARLGLYGTAKLQGERVPLGYYLLRRPLAAARAWSGW